MTRPAPNGKAYVWGYVDQSTVDALDQFRGPYITRSKAISVILKEVLNVENRE